MTKERVAHFPSDDFRRNAKNYQEPLLSRNLAVAAFLGEIGKRHSVSAGVVAIAWTLHHPAITAAIVGGRNAKQVEGVIPAATFRLSDEEFSEIQAYLAQHVSLTSLPAAFSPPMYSKQPGRRPPNPVKQSRSDRTLGHHVADEEVMCPHVTKSVLAQMRRELGPMLHTVKQGLAEHFPLACLDTRETYFLHFIPIFRLCRLDKLTELLERVFACAEQMFCGTSVQLVPSRSRTIGYGIRKQ